MTMIALMSAILVFSPQNAVAFKKLSKIWKLAGKFFPAICFQSFESKSLEKIRDLAFKNLKASWRIFSSDLLSKLWKQIAGKNLPAIRFQIFES